ncbi:MAG: phosphopyruvate hydratase [Elusimicrobiota bacterium]
MTARIKEVRAREILDSRGLPTLEAEVSLSDGSFGRAAVPSGASTGEHEAVELRDGDVKRFLGKGVRKAVENVQGPIAKAVAGLHAEKQASVDGMMIELDSSENKGNLGANAILAVSMAVSRAAAASRKKPLYEYLRETFDLKLKDWLLPAPMLNIINGGVHADSGLDVQEFMIVPTGASSFPEALRMGAEVYQHLKKLLAEAHESTAVGDEGGFAPRLKTHDEALDTIQEAIGRAGYEGKIRLALDAAASEFFGDGKYGFEGSPRTAKEMTGIYGGWIAKHDILSLEDPLAEDDWAGWKGLTSELGSKVRIIGDDIFVTNPKRLERGVQERSANAILIKLNQIGSVTETVSTVRKAHAAGFTAVISHRSGETEDPYIADFAVALNAGAIKTGAPCRSERLAKYNQLLRIHDELGPRAVYAGDRAFRSAGAGAVNA